MKILGKKFIGWCMVLAVGCGLLAGCGEAVLDTEPADRLQSLIVRMQSGVPEEWDQTEGAEFLLSANPEDQKRFINLWSAFLQNMDVTYTMKELEDTRAVVAVKGKTGKLSSITQKVYAEVEERVKAYAENGTEPTQEELVQTFKDLTVENFEAYADQMEFEDVDLEIVMQKQDPGGWCVAKESSEDLEYLLFGSTDLANDPGLKDLGLNLKTSQVVSWT